MGQAVSMGRGMSWGFRSVLAPVRCRRRRGPKPTRRWRQKDKIAFKQRQKSSVHFQQFKKSRQQTLTELSSHLDHAPPWYLHLFWCFRFSPKRLEYTERRLLLYSLSEDTRVASYMVPCGSKTMHQRGHPRAGKMLYMHSIHYIPSQTFPQEEDTIPIHSLQADGQPHPLVVVSDDDEDDDKESFHSLEEEHNFQVAVPPSQLPPAFGPIVPETDSMPSSGLTVSSNHGSHPLALDDRDGNTSKSSRSLASASSSSFVVIPSTTLPPHQASSLSSRPRDDPPSTYASIIVPFSPNRPPLVMCHGYGGGTPVFVQQYRFLAQHGWEVHSIDWLGMGRSSRPTMRPPLFKPTREQKRTMSRQELKRLKIEQRCLWTEDLFVNSFEQWRKNLKIEKMVLMGHSMGGYLAALYALKYPQHVDRLVLVSPMGIPPGEQSREFIRLIEIIWSWRLTPAQFIKATGPFSKPFVKKAFQVRGLQMSNPTETKLFIDYLAQLWNTKTSTDKSLYTLLRVGAHPHMPLIDRLPALSSDIAIDLIFGEEDWMWDPQIEILPRLMPSHRITFYQAAGGHQLYIEEPRSFNELLHALLLRHHYVIPAR